MITNAIKALRPTASFSVIDEDFSKIIWYSTDVDMPTQAEIEAKILELQAEYNAKEYQRKRAAEYPSYADQLDTIFHKGLDAWKAEIQAIKDKYPKGA